MTEISETIEAIEKEIRETPYHKGTEHYIGKLRAKLSRLKDKQIDAFLKSGGGGGEGYAVKKHGDATVVLVGPPSAGKSTLLNKLTNAQSKVAQYDFTTVSVIPGMLIHKNAYIQIFDVPGLIEGAQRGKGRGKEVISVTRGADLLILMTDVKRVNYIDILTKELEASGIRINKQKANIRVDKKKEGGLEIKSNIKQDLDNQTIKEIAMEFGIKNAEISLKEKVTMENLFDSFSGSRVFIPAIYIINKVDQDPKLQDNEDKDGYYYISAQKDVGVENLKEVIWEKLGFVTVYLVKEDEKPNEGSPIIMRKGDKISNILPKLGSSFEVKYTLAKIWGKQAKFPGQEVPLSTVISEGLQVRFLS